MTGVTVNNDLYNKKIINLCDQFLNNQVTEDELISQWQDCAKELSDEYREDPDFYKETMNEIIEEQKKLQVCLIEIHDEIGITNSHASSDSALDQSKLIASSKDSLPLPSTQSITQETLKQSYLNDQISKTEYYDQLYLLLQANNSSPEIVKRLTQTTVEAATRLKQIRQNNAAQVEKINEKLRASKESLINNAQNTWREALDNLTDKTKYYGNSSQTFFNHVSEPRHHAINYVNCLAGILMIIGGAMFIAGVITLIWPLIAVGAATGGIGCYVYEP